MFLTQQFFRDKKYIFSFQAGCAWFAYQRFRQGADSAFAPTYEADPSSLPGAAYTSYPGK